MKKKTPSKAYLRFEHTIRRSLDLVSLYETMSKIQKGASKSPLNNVEVGDLVRAAIVLSVAALDSYVTDVFSEKLNPHLRSLRRAGKKIPDKMVEELSDAGLDTRAALELLAMQRPHRRLRTLINTRFQKFTAQRFDTINDLFLAFDLKNILQNAQKLCKRKNLLNRVDGLIQRRHSIAHGGDLNQHGKLRSVNHTDVQKRVKELLELVAAMEEILGNKIR